MASEPSDENESRNLIERRRWGDGTKVYSRRIFRARRKSINSGATTATAVVLNSDDVTKGNEESNLLNGIASVKSLQNLVAQDGESSHQDLPLQQEPTPEQVLPVEDSERVGQEESSSLDGTAVSDCMQVPQESNKAVETLAERESREAIELRESREAMELECSEMEVETRCRQAMAVEPDNRESLDVEAESMEVIVVEPESREVMAVEPETRLAMVVEPETTEATVVEPETREGKLVEPESIEEMEVEPQTGEEIVVEREGRETIVVEPESRELVAPESTEAVAVEAEIREAIELPEIRESMEPENRETVVEAENRETVEAESIETVVMQGDIETESRETIVVEPESRETIVVEPESRETIVVEPESRETFVVELESRETIVVELESRELVAPESTEAMAVEAQSREVIELPESRENTEPENRETVVEPENRETVVETESRETVVMRGDIATVDAEQESREILEAELETREIVVVPESKVLVVEAESRETVREPESRETVGEPESREIMGEPESRETLVDPESRETEHELESREIAMVESESREVPVVPPRNTDVVVLPEIREVVPPVVNGNGVVEANGILRLPQRQSQLVESQLHMPVVTRVEDRVRINMSGARSSDEIRELRRELETELDQVRSLYKKLEAKELQVTAYNRSKLTSNIGVINGSNNNYPVSSFAGGGVGNYGGYSQPQPQYASSDIVDRRALMRVNSEVGSVGNQETRPFSRSLSVSVVENNHGVGDFVEREKRTPKANQFYRNSEFLLGKDRLPPESNKKLKPNGVGRKHGGEMDYGFGFGYDKQHRERVFRSCSSLLQRLMKHKFGWVFNVPVDAKKLGLHDYHDIIKHPMDLGTIKTRLSQNYYRSPKEFVEDVRLVFHNAMTYNPKGQDVHVMAETLLQIFEERWAVIQTEYNPDWRYQMYHDAGLPTPTSRKAPPAQFYTPAHAPAYAPITFPVTPIGQMRTLDRSESMTTPADPKLKPANFTHVGRTPVLKKPKAKDPNKRDMTYEEKQKLSTNLQSLPSEKLDAIVQIIKKRNSTLSQHDDEIEVDIDSVDAETLWELDRFVTNYKKNLSKNKRKAEIALQARTLAAQTIPAMNIAPAVVDVQKKSGIGQNDAPPAQVEKQGDNVSRSSSSSSSSSDSGSSSSDSDSDSSSAYGSDAGRSPGA